MQLKDVSENLKNVRDLGDVTEETSLISLRENFSEICKSTLFQMSLRHCMRRLKDASGMHPWRPGYLRSPDILNLVNLLTLSPSSVDVSKTSNISTNSDILINESY